MTAPLDPDFVAAEPPLPLFEQQVDAPRKTSRHTGIEWTSRTWNPVTGCDRTSPGCDHCYALTMAKRLKAMGQPKYQNDGSVLTSGPGFAVTLHEGDTLNEPRRWRKPCRVFVNSMSDLFHSAVPDSFIEDVWDTMAVCPQHTFQVLTKRPQRMPKLFRDLDGRTDPIPALPNVWLGTSIESDAYTFRARHLNATPAAVRFLSLEPLLGPLPSLDLTGIDWVIIGGESGSGARPMEIEWVEDIIDQAQAADVAVFVKQLGSVLAKRYGLADRKGGDMAEFPLGLQIRRFPS